MIIAKFNYAELAKWIDNYREVPESDDDVFVLDAVININDIIPKGILSLYYSSIIFLYLHYIQRRLFDYQYQLKN